MTSLKQIPTILRTIRLRTIYNASARFRDSSDSPTAYLQRYLETIEDKPPSPRMDGL